jgi:Domain of unknown function (DUF4352)
VAHPAHQAQLFVADKHMWRLTLTRVAVISELHGTYDSSRARGKYVVVFMTAQNVGKVPQTLAIDQDFAVTDAQGRQFGRANSDANSAAYQKYKLDDYYDTVQPTFSERVAVVFDVARDARGLTLVNVPLFSDRTQKLFTLGI